ncbi:serine/threonine-protein kinase [Ktedonobacter racemifer]|uniref:non-specific serine/threonine protein kinase n=1 Tax=Ktedonobacter racemifer DSM 44963 TaxID=485913 RepID=D6TCL8_KTERA|nr:serine/threonine-protein kinase [Ktedonobacter racemifer]EFH88132.1 serine/threonine protein kinase [Ktedonobacter racemifer DSM 44963]
MPLDGLQIHNYRLLRLVGNGGMGEIYLADDMRLARQVAVKIVRTNEAEDESGEASSKALRIFQREARMISMLDHPHILPLFDYGVTMLNAAQLTYLVMPYHAAGSLDIWLRKLHRAKLPPLMVEPFVRQAANALQYAHDHQVVHQDVKSSNFLVSNSYIQPDVPHLLLSDFGLARLRLGSSNSSKHARGTPNYMAPEQWRGEAVPASDQYSLAIMSYKLLTGHYPFQGDAVTILYQHIQTVPPDASQLDPQISPELSAVIQRGLAKKPEERYPTIVAFAQAFHQALHGASASAEPVLEHSISECSAELPSQLSLAESRPVSRSVSSHSANSPRTPSSGYGTPSSPITGVDWPDPSLRTSEPADSAEEPPVPLPQIGEYQLKQASSELKQSKQIPTFTPINKKGGEQEPTLSMWSTASSNDRERKKRHGRLLLSAAMLLIILGLLGTLAMNTVLNSYASTFMPGISLQAQTPIPPLATQTLVKSSTAQTPSTSPAAQTPGTPPTTQTPATLPATQTPGATGSPAIGKTPGSTQASPTSPGVSGAPPPAPTAGPTGTSTRPTPIPPGSGASKAINPFQVQGVDITFDSPTISASCGGIATTTYIATITVSDNSPGGVVAVQYSSDNGVSYNTTTLTFAAGETRKSFSFSRQLTISLNLLNLIKLDVEHTGIITTTSPNVVTKSAAPSETCHL